MVVTLVYGCDVQQSGAKPTGAHLEAAWVASLERSCIQLVVGSSVNTVRLLLSLFGCWCIDCTALCLLLCA